eukprot:s1355_g13.t1
MLALGYSNDDLKRARFKLLLLLHPDKAQLKPEVHGQDVIDQVAQAYLVQDRAWDVARARAANAPDEEEDIWLPGVWFRCANPMCASMSKWGSFCSKTCGDGYIRSQYWFVRTGRTWCTCYHGLQTAIPAWMELGLGKTWAWIPP